MTYPQTAVSRFNFFLATPHFPGSVVVPISGFTSAGDVRVDISNLLVSHFTLLDSSLTSVFTLSVPADPYLVGYPFDVQTVDADFGVNDLAWSDNDVEIAIAVPSFLVINEVDYDQPGTDSASFVEILNVSNGPVSLAGIELRLVNGSTMSQYASYAMPPGYVLAPGQYLVIRNPTVVVPGGALVLDVVGDFLQNGAPDGLALVDGNGSLLDALSYEGSMTNVSMPGVQATSLVEGAPFPGADNNSTPASLGRVINGLDTDDAATDWGVLLLPTPGGPN